MPLDPIFFDDFDDDDDDTGDCNCEFVRFLVTLQGKIVTPDWNPSRPIAPRRICLIPIDLLFLENDFCDNGKRYKQTLNSSFNGATELTSATLTMLADGKLSVRQVRAFQEVEEGYGCCCS